MRKVNAEFKDESSKLPLISEQIEVHYSPNIPVSSMIVDVHDVSHAGGRPVLCFCDENKATSRSTVLISARVISGYHIEIMRYCVWQDCLWPVGDVLVTLRESVCLSGGVG